jgi:hypothetical protein
MCPDILAPSISGNGIIQPLLPLMTSALHCVSCYCARGKHPSAGAHGYRIRSMEHVGDMLQGRLSFLILVIVYVRNLCETLTGLGRWSLREGILSPGASKATTGEPNVVPIRAAKEPPRLCPVTQILASGYMYVRLLYRFCTVR